MNKVELFKNDIIELMKKYKLTLSHEDSHGAFLIEDYDEYNIRYFKDAIDKTNNINILIENIDSILNMIEKDKLLGIYDWQDYSGLEKVKEDLNSLINTNIELNNRIIKALEFIEDTDNYFEDGENWQNIEKIKKILKGVENNG